MFADTLLLITKIYTSAIFKCDLNVQKPFGGHCIQREEVETDKKKRKTVKSGQEFVSVWQVKQKC